MKEVENAPVCWRCGHVPELISDIAPAKERLGLVVHQCPHCGTVRYTGSMGGRGVDEYW